ncbi:unnamed protein product, partial [marine sediment metagenome]
CTVPTTLFDGERLSEALALADCLEATAKTLRRGVPRAKGSK